MGFESVGHLDTDEHEYSTVKEHQKAISYVGVSVFRITKFPLPLVNVPDNDHNSFKKDKAFDSMFVRELLGLLLKIFQFLFMLSDPFILLGQFGCKS